MEAKDLMIENTQSEYLEQKAEQYACKFSNSKYGHDKIKAAYIAGVKEANKHPNIIWHDSNKEQPTPMSRVIVLDEYNNIDVLTNVVEVYKDKKWAYIDNFIKN